MKLRYSAFEVIKLLTPIVEVNDEIQEWMTNYGASVPVGLAKSLADLDWAVRNVGEENEHDNPTTSFPRA